MTSPTPDDAQAFALEQRAAEATRQGRRAEAVELWAQLLALRPQHLAALTQLGQAAHEAGDGEAARAAFQRAAQADPRNPQRWVTLAMVQQQLGDDAGLEASLFQALSLEPRELMALLMRGQWHERHGRRAQAAASYRAALAVAPSPEVLRQDLRPWMTHASRFAQQHQETLAAHVDEQMADALRQCDGPALERFRLSMDIVLGRKRRHDAQPLVYFYPQLLPVEFFDRAEFPWLEAVEAGTDRIRAEFQAVLQQDRGFVPYIHYGPDQPVDQWAQLNHNPDWSVLHLVKGGSVVAENATRCPQTLALWSEHVPAPRQSGRTPVLLFSLLKPRTHIPAHTGASNVRLLTHLPLIVPPGCRFRVGNTVRTWEPGRAWVFDDTIEHEAWNDSDQLRVIVIFDVWHPRISAEERLLIEKLQTALDAFGLGGGGVDYAA